MNRKNAMAELVLPIQVRDGAANSKVRDRAANSSAMAMML
jgi:hypothetical protein